MMVILNLLILCVLISTSRGVEVGTPQVIGSTVPANGDQNPYGVAVAFETVGKLRRGDVLVSNFNNNGTNGGTQGRGTTIVKFRGSKLSLFAKINPSKVHCPGGVGLTTALEILYDGYVVVGSLPTDVTGAISGAGCLIILNSEGHVVKTITGHHINGPWDMTSLLSRNHALLFVTNVLNGNVADTESGTIVNNGTVVRIKLNTYDNSPPEFSSSVVIGNNFAEKLDPAALIIGPTGVALVESNLFVADTVNSRIVKIRNAIHRTKATSGEEIFQGTPLNGPLGLAFAPEFGLVAANAQDGNLVVLDTSGEHTQTIDTGAGPGALFGLAFSLNGETLFFVNDAANELESITETDNDDE